MSKSATPYKTSSVKQKLEATVKRLERILASTTIGDTSELIEKAKALIEKAIKEYDQN